MKKKICIITSSFPKSKNDSRHAGIFVRDFVKLLNQDYEIFVLAPATNVSKKYDEDIKVHFFPWFQDEFGLSSLNPKNPVHFLKLLSFVLSGISTTMKFIKKNEIDVCFAMWAVPSGLFALFSKIFFKTPYLVWVLGSDIWRISDYPFGKSILRKILQNARTVFSDGMKLANDVELLCDVKSIFLASNRILEKGQGLLNYRKFDTTRINFVFVGRFHTHKGIDILIEAINNLNKNEKEKVLFHIFGGGPLENKIKTMVKEQNLENTIIINGYLDAPDVLSTIEKSDFVIIPSRIESIPLVLSDAMQADRPVLVTNVGDMDDLLKKFNVGIIVEPNAKSIADGIRKIIHLSDDNTPDFSSGIKKLRNHLDLNLSVNKVKEVLDSLT